MRRSEAVEADDDSGARPSERKHSSMWEAICAVLEMKMDRACNGATGDGGACGRAIGHAPRSSAGSSENNVL